MNHFFTVDTIIYLGLGQNFNFNKISLVTQFDDIHWNKSTQISDKEELQKK